MGDKEEVIRGRSKNKTVTVKTETYAYYGELRLELFRKDFRVLQTFEDTLLYDILGDNWFRMENRESQRSFLESFREDKDVLFTKIDETIPEEKEFIDSLDIIFEHEIYNK